MSRTRPFPAAAAARPGRAAAAALGLLLLWTLPAAAVGVDGVDLRVDLPTTDEGRPVLALGGEDAGEDGAEEHGVEVRLRNTTEEPREVRVYAVAAHASEDESFGLAGAGSAAWFGLEEEQLELAAGEEATRRAAVDPSAVPRDATHVAVVLETGTESTLVTRAARVIELGEHPPGGLPGWLVLATTALLAAAVAGHALHARARRRERPGTSASAAVDPAPALPVS